MNQKKILKLPSRRTKTFSFFLLLIIFSLLSFFMIEIISRFDFMKILELKSFDLRVKTKPQDKRHYPDSNLVIIALDEYSFEKIKEPSLLWTSKFTDIIKYLQKAHIKAIGIDYQFQKSADKFIQSGLREVLNKIPKEQRKIKENLLNLSISSIDAEFALMIRNTNSVLMAYLDENKKLIQPLEIISRISGKWNMGLVDVNRDIDGVTRQISSHLTDKDGISYPSFPFLIASRFLGKENQLRDGSFLKTINFFKNYSMLINYIGPPGSFKTFSFKKILDKAYSKNIKFFKDNFKNKIVLFGLTGKASLDFAYTPFKVKMAGVEVHANAINTILHKDYIKALDSRINMLILFMIILVCFLIGFCFSFWKSLLSAVFIGLAYFFITFEIFHKFNLWMNLTAPIFSIPLVLMFSYGYRYMIVEREKNWIRKVLGRYISKPVAKKFLENPEILKLGGEEREVTLLFSDINNFTTLSEEKKPEEIVTALNEYFILMEEVIFMNKGTLNQFMGDEIMALFGAPEYQEDHQKQAVFTALKMREELKKWKTKRQKIGEFYFDIKIGIHCGKVVVGNIGSPHRTEYTAIGDCVNTASRIMGLNKKLNTDILISQVVYQKVKEFIEVEDKGFHSIKGKEENVHIYFAKDLKNLVMQ